MNFHFHAVWKPEIEKYKITFGTSPEAKDSHSWNFSKEQFRSFVKELKNERTRISDLRSTGKLKLERLVFTTEDKVPFFEVVVDETGFAQFIRFVDYFEMVLEG